MITPLDYYYQKCQSGFIKEDSLQVNALKVLQQVHADLLVEEQRRSSIWSWFRKNKLVKGVYLWGGVGVGKTFLMDCFFQTLPFEKKLRMHFYAFMQRIHKELAELQGHQDPLYLIADRLAENAIVLCFDEFFVSDIQDAMMLGRLLKALFARGVCLVTTSNLAPDELYKNGLQRDQFIPAIEAIIAATFVFHISTQIDYRLRHLKEAGVFYTPLNAESRKKMEENFKALTAGDAIDETPIMIYGRSIPVRSRAQNVIWFDFNVICSVPRSQLDYLAIAKLYKVVCISDIPAIEPGERDKISLFISLVDVFYDARIRLVISSAEPVEKIYARGYKIQEYARTHSRLLEMQSADYFAGEE